jgi:hypothetical protein
MHVYSFQSFPKIKSWMQSGQYKLYQAVIRQKRYYHTHPEFRTFTWKKNEAPDFLVPFRRPGGMPGGANLKSAP